VSAFALGAQLAPHAPAIGAALRRRVMLPKTPMIADAVVDTLVGRIAGLRGETERADFLTWLADLGASYGDVEALRRLLDDLPDAIARALRDADTDPLAARELDAFARDVRTTVERSWRPLARVEDERLDEQDARIDALVVRLEARDPLSSEHSRAVAGWCARLGRRLGLDANEVAFARRCGLLHDVGKSLTPLEILNAPRALDEREWRVMRAHAAAGEALVRQVRELRPFSPAVRSHHERLDGKGYPDGLRTSAIPLMARIVAVADCFNAMIGRRPYRLPMPPSRALEELVIHRGTQLDPEIVDAMVDVVLG
jgi:putative nucleotidyltransferase with HDIG domain